MTKPTKNKGMKKPKFERGQKVYSIYHNQVIVFSVAFIFYDDDWDNPWFYAPFPSHPGVYRLFDFSRNEKDVFGSRKKVLAEYEKSFGKSWFESKWYERATFDPFVELMKNLKPKAIKKEYEGG